MPNDNIFRQAKRLERLGDEELAKMIEGETGK